MEYKIVSNNSANFWEDKKNNTLGIGDNLQVTVIENTIKVESHEIEVLLKRGNKKAKISVNDKPVFGKINDLDKLFLGSEVIIEFRKSDKRKKIIKFPSINWNMWLGVIVLLSILLIIFFGWKKTTENKLEKKYQEILSVIKDNMVKSNDIQSIDPETSLKILNETKSKVLEIKDNKIHESEIKELEKQINEKLAVSGSSEVVNFEEIYDTKIADTVDRKYDRIYISGESIVLVDKTSKYIVEVNLNSKAVTKHEIGSEIVNIIDVTKSIKNVYIYDGQSIWDIQKNKLSDIGNEVFVKIYSWNNSWYLLGQDGKISKYTDNKISNWTQENTTLIDKPISMSIDGTVWVTDQSGSVANYEKGVYKKWISSIKFVGEKINSISTIANSEKLTLISDKKVYMFDKKSGKLLATYNMEKIGIIGGQMTGNDQIYVLGQDQKIYKVK